MILFNFINYFLFLLLVVVKCEELRLCSKNRHKTGAWKMRRDLHNATKAFHCCGQEGKLEDYLHDTRTCGTEPENWLEETGNREHETIVTGNACICDQNEGRDTVNRRERYEWVPESCHLLRWNATQFCERLGNRTILFVGDSSMQQSATTLMSMVTRGGGKCANHLIVGKSYRLFLPHLNSTTKPDVFVRKHKPDICVMGSGAHCSDLDDMYSVLANVQKKIPELMELSPKTKYYWKTINPGHTDCKNFTQPLGVPLIYDRDVYNYHSFPRYDEAAYEFVERHGWGMIDMSPLYLRPDAHADCLHYCVPGPLDIISNVMLTMMMTGEI